MMQVRAVRMLVARVAFGSVLLSFVLGPTGDVAAASAAVSKPQEAREVRTVWTSEFGVPRPAALAYVPARGELLVAGDQPGSTSVLRLGFDEDPRGTFQLPGLSSPATLAFDAARNRLTAVSGSELIAVAARDLKTDRPPVSRTDITGLGLQDPRGASFDPATGTWFVLDSGAGAVVEVPGPGRPGPATRISLADLGPVRFAGIAFNPSDGLLYVASADRDLLYGLDRSGTVHTTYSLASLGLQDPTAMTFAPSSDATDDPRTLHLFIADAGGSSMLGGVMEVTLAAAVAVAAPVVTATLVQTIATSAWNPASPDPSGVVYLPGPDRLEVSDSEVDETTGAGYHGVNLWQITRSGTVTDTGTTIAYSKEPTGLGYDPGTNTLFISDDSKRRIFVVKRGSDGRFGTSDDVVSSIDAGAYGSTDTEDPEFDPASGHLFFLDGVGTEVYDVNPVNGVFGDGNDVVTHFDVGKFGPSDWEGLGSDPATGNLLVGARKTKQIYEVTKSGSLVRIIDASGISGLKYISGLAMAPASNGSGKMNYWIVDRAVDNGADPNENDGKLFEVSIPSSTNNPPTVTNPGTKTNAVGDSVSYQIGASDPDGDAITSYNATGLPIGLSVNTSTGLISGTTTTAGTYDVTISATDSNGATGSTAFTWNVAAPGGVLTFAPSADTFVRSDYPDKNFGSKPGLAVDASPTKHVLLKFTVSGVGTSSIQSVKLRLYCVDDSSVGGDFYPVADNSWQENTVTWNTAPAAGPTAVASLGAVSLNTWHEVDVTSLVTGDGTYSVLIGSPSKDAAKYTSKEGAAGFGPQLVVTLT